MIIKRTPDCAEVMAQQCVRLTIVLCNTTTRAEDHGPDQPISPNPYPWGILCFFLCLQFLFVLCLLTVDIDENQVIITVLDDESEETYHPFIGSFHIMTTISTRHLYDGCKDSNPLFHTDIPLINDTHNIISLNYLYFTSYLGTIHCRQSE